MHRSSAILLDTAYKPKFFQLKEEATSYVEVNFPLPISPEELPEYLGGKSERSKQFREGFFTIVNELIVLSEEKKVSFECINKLQQFCDNFLNYRADCAEDNIIRFGLYSEGVTALATINELLCNKILPMGSCHIILTNLMNKINGCAPGSKTKIINAKNQLLALLGLPAYLMSIRYSIAESTVGMLLNEYGILPIYEIHYGNILLNRISFDIGINALKDEYEEELNGEYIEKIYTKLRNILPSKLNLMALIENILHEECFQRLPQKLLLNDSIIYADTIQKLMAGLSRFGEECSDRRFFIDEKSIIKLTGEFEDQIVVDPFYKIKITLSIISRLVNGGYLNRTAFSSCLKNFPESERLQYADYLLEVDIAESLCRNIFTNVLVLLPANDRLTWVSKLNKEIIEKMKLIISPSTAGSLFNVISCFPLNDRPCFIAIILDEWYLGYGILNSIEKIIDLVKHLNDKQKVEIFDKYNPQIKMVLEKIIISEDSVPLLFRLLKILPFTVVSKVLTHIKFSLPEHIYAVTDVNIKLNVMRNYMQNINSHMHSIAYKQQCQTKMKYDYKDMEINERENIGILESMFSEIPLRAKNLIKSWVLTNLLKGSSIELLEVIYEHAFFKERPAIARNLFEPAINKETPYQAKIRERIESLKNEKSLVDNSGGIKRVREADHIENSDRISAMVLIKKPLFKRC